jgi:cytochrome c2
MARHRTLIEQALWSVLAACGLFAVASGAWADDDQEARDLYAKTCSKCHGLITEDVLSWTPDNLRVSAVTLPLGPSLTSVYMRPAGSVPDYPYSKSFQKMLENAWVWDEDALDGWLTSTQDFIRGSTMFLKVAEPDRGKIIAYLKKYATYTPE